MYWFIVLVYISPVFLCGLCHVLWPLGVGAVTWGLRDQSILHPKLLAPQKVSTWCLSETPKNLLQPFRTDEIKPFKRLIFPYQIWVIPKSLSRLAIGWVRGCSNEGNLGRFLDLNTCWSCWSHLQKKGSCSVCVILAYSRFQMFYKGFIVLPGSLTVRSWKFAGPQKERSLPSIISDGLC